MNFDLLLKGGEVVTAAGVVTADVGVRDGLITAIGRYLASDRVCPTYDVRGQWVTPAFVELFGSSDAQLELSKRAASAGVSLLVSVVTPKPWESPDQTVRRVAVERRESWVDYAYAVRVLAGQLPTYEALKEAQKLGLAYLLVCLSPRTDGLGLQDEELYTLLERAKNAGVSVAVWLEHQGFQRTIQRPTFRALKGADALFSTYS